MDFFEFILIGIGTGIIAGMLGLGGGLIFTPVLLGIYEAEGFAQPHLWAVGTSLACTFVTAVSSSTRQYLKGNFDFRRSLIIGLFAIIGLLLGRWVISADFFNVRVFRIVYAAVLGYVALQFTLGQLRSRKIVDDDSQSTTLSYKCGFLTGSAGGFIATLAGIGGGGVMVPIMHFGFRLPLKTSVSLSSGAIVLISLFGAIGMALIVPESNGPVWSVGHVDLAMALPLAIGAFGGGFLGVQWSHKLKPTVLSILFGLVLGSMFYKVVSGLF